MSAIVIRAKSDHHTIETARAVREALKLPHKHPLHFRNLRHERRIPIVRLIAEMPCKIASVLIHKPSLPDPDHFQNSPFSLYQYATSVLIERISWLVKDDLTPGEGNGTCDLVFSNRSAMSYDHLRNHLANLRNHPETHDLKIDWSIIQPELVKAVDHSQLAGLQLADAVASGCYYAVNKNPYGDIEDRYLRLLLPVLYRHERAVLGYGLNMICPRDQEGLSAVLNALEE